MLLHALHATCSHAHMHTCAVKQRLLLQDLNVPHQYLLAIRLRDQALQEGTALTWRNILCATLPSALTLYYPMASGKYASLCLQGKGIVCSYQRASDLTKYYSSAGPPAEWGGSIPNSGTLCFDYLSHEEPPEGAKVASFNQLTAALEACDVTFTRAGTSAVLPTGLSESNTLHLSVRLLCTLVLHAIIYTPNLCSARAEA